MAVTRRDRRKEIPVPATAPAIPARAKANTTSKAAPKANKLHATSPDRLPILPFKDVSAFESYLDEHHDKIPGLHLKHAKKASGIPSIGTWDAIEVALCFGWINGQGNSCKDDPNYYLSRYTPRRPKSTWSQINVKLVEKLIEQGRMRPAGLEAVEAAKADGRWARAYASPTDMTVPADFQAVLQENEPAKAFFGSLGKGGKYNVLLRVELASPAARAKRIQALVEGLAVGKIPGESTEKSLKSGRKKG
jgi:uncharacterized protein YdeI (YjbR/CyaY-like superfamily)